MIACCIDASGALSGVVFWLTRTDDVPDAARTGRNRFYRFFDIGTSFFQGMMILLRGWSDQSSLYYLWLPYIVLSIRFVLPSVWWSWGIVAWGIAHFAGYTWFDLFPYPWSYAPLVPGVVILAGLVFQGLSESAEDWDTLRYFLEDTFRPFLVLAQAFSLRAIVAGFTAERPPRSSASEGLANRQR